MSDALTWVPDVLLGAGLKVALVPGWDFRGHAGMGPVLGVMCHTTAGARQGNMPSLNTLVHGREGRPGPLAQLGLGRDGTCHVIAAGCCHHAAAGRWQGVATGDSSFIGIAAENTGRGDDPWPAVQMDAYRRCTAARLKHIGRPKARPRLRHGRFPVGRGGPDGRQPHVQRRVGVEVDGDGGTPATAAVQPFERRIALAPGGIAGAPTGLALAGAGGAGVTRKARRRCKLASICCRTFGFEGHPSHRHACPAR